MRESLRPGSEAVLVKGWFAANKWLLLRRFTQALIMALFLAGPLAGVWVVKGNLTSSLTLGVLPLTDPFVLLQTLLAGHVAAATALTGAAIIMVFYGLVGGRAYCAFVCPLNVVTDLAAWLSRRWDWPKGWQPSRGVRFWLLAAVMISALFTGILAWEFLNPVTIVHRALVYGFGYAWTIVLAVFLFDLIVSRHGWCGHLCPMGAFYGLLGTFSPVRVSAKNREACNDCMDCFHVCPEPQVIKPALKGEKNDIGPVILSHQCTNCARCIDVCNKSVFKFSTRFNNKLNSPTLNVKEAIS